MRKLFFIFTFALLALTLPQVSHALSITTTGEYNFMSTITPTFPPANETATIALSSLESDIARSTITWGVNGKEVLKGIGEGVLTLTTGDVGKKMTVTVTAITPDGQTSTKVIEWIPADAVIAWEADTYTPPLYRGKALPTPGSTIKLSALPDVVDATGKQIAAQNLFYTWKMDGQDDSTISGVGKSVVAYDISSLPGDTRFSVEVSTIDKSIKVTREIVISTVLPFLVVYPEHPLRGTEQAAPLSLSPTFSTSESVVRAEPFFLSNPLSKLIFEWTLNNGTPEIGTAVRSLRLDKGVNGTASLLVTASTQNSMSQTARQKFNLTFSR